MAKRSCDACVRRKSRCDSERPCKPCAESKQRMECTYLKPILKRGPKSARRSKPTSRQRPAYARLLPNMKSLQAVETGTYNPLMMVQRDEVTPLPASMFASILDAYQSRMYPVWPVLDADALMTKLKASETKISVVDDCFILATALSAATIAQLRLGSEDAAAQKVSAAVMEEECMRLRYQYNYRNRPTVYNVLASFFLHVYHAKLDNRNAAMMHLQEAISFARILEMDKPRNNLASCQLIYTLLWVSERGYSIQHGMVPSIRETPHIQSIDGDCCFDAHQKGLLDLAQLFAAFDTATLEPTGALPSKSQVSWHMGTKQQLIRANERLERYKRRQSNWDLVQYADFHITKAWMRILLWQQAVRCGVLSSHASVEAMTLMFPCIIARDLLESFTVMSRDHLIPLGRDQVVKSFEVTNTLADVLLCRLKCGSGGDTAQCGSYNGQVLQSLHGLFEATSPFLVDDKNLEEMLRQKLGQVFTKSSVETIPGAILGNDYLEQFPAADISEANNMTGFLREKE